MKKAVVYCRVSSDKQVREGNGLAGQEKRCRDYANFYQLCVERTFKDEGVSGGIIDRPGMQELLDYISNKSEKYFVIVDDLNRLARDVVAHFTLKKAIADASSELLCVNMKLEDNPEGHFIETIMAASAELERNRNQRQVKHRMKARMELGYWVFDNPPGYKYIKHPIEGKLLIPDEPKATIIKTALEGFACGRFQTQKDVQKYLIDNKFVHKGEFKTVHLEQVKRLLTRPLYSGVIDYPKWSITRRKGKHEGLISEDTFNTIQAKLNNSAKQPFQKELNKDFPLRGFALCPACKKPYTASWSKGRKSKYPYYRCNNTDCANGQKSIRKETLENTFANSLIKVTPSHQILSLAKAITKEVHKKKLVELKDSQKIKERELCEIESNIEKAVNKLITSNNETINNILENKISELEEQKTKIKLSISKYSNPHINFETALDNVITFVRNPHEIWINGSLKQKQMVQKLVFTRPTVIYPRQTVGTTNLSLPFKMLQESETRNIHLVEVLSENWNHFFETIIEWSKEIEWLTAA